MNTTFTRNVLGAPGLGIGPGNIATSGDVASGASDEPSATPLIPGISNGANAIVRQAPASCVEIRLFGRTF